MEDFDRMCWICHTEESNKDKLCNPCRCSGTIKYAHQECLLLWIFNSNAEKCDICHHKYKFKDVYKPGTPKILPLFVLIKGLILAVYKVLVTSAWCILQLLKFICAFYINGHFFILSTGFCGDNITYNRIAMYFVTGVFLTFLAYTHRCLFREMKVRVFESARRHRESNHGIPNPASNESIPSIFQLFSAEAEREITNSHISRVENTGENILYDSNVSEEYRTPFTTFGNSDVHNERPSLEFGEVLYSLFSFVLEIFGLVVPVMFLPAMYAIGRIIPVNLPFPSFIVFLERVSLKEIYFRLIALGMVFLVIAIVSSCIQKGTTSDTSKAVCVFLRIYYIIFLNVFLMYLTFGLFLHYMFEKFFNNGIRILSIEDHYNSAANSLISLILHVFIGFMFSTTTRNILLKFKKHLRPGVMHFVSENSDTRINELYEISKMNMVDVLFRAILSLLVLAAIYGVGIVVVVYSYKNSGIRFSIETLPKFFIYYKAFSMLLCSNDLVCDYVVLFLNIIIKFQSRVLRMENFLYGAPTKDYEENMLRWCVNRNELFGRRLVKTRKKEIPTEKDILKHFNKKLSENFSVFYIPDLFSSRCVLMVVTSIALFYCFYIACFISARAVLCFVNPERYIKGSGDVVFLFIISGILYLLWAIAHVVVNVSHRVRFSKIMLGLVKCGLVNVYVNILYPVFCCFIATVMLSRNRELNFRTLYFQQSILMFFNNILLAGIIVHRYVLRMSPEHYSFRMLMRELYRANTLISMFFTFICFYDVVMFFLSINNVKFAIFCVITGFIAFVSRKICQSVFENRSFYRRLFDENYLVERKIVNANDG